MPVLGGSTDEIDYAAAAEQRNASPSTEQRTAASAYLTSRNNSGVLSAVTGAVFGGALDLVDTVGSSVGLTDRQQINDKFLTAVGSPGVTAWFDANRGAAEVGSGLYGIALADTIAGRILKPGSKAMQAIRAVPFAKNIATLDRQYEVAMRLAKVTQNEVARRGLTGTDRFIGGNLSFPYMGQSFSTSRGGAVKNLFAVGAKRSLTRNALIETIMATTLNQNSMLYSDELSHNLTWSGIGLAGGVFIDGLVNTYALRKMANSEQVRQLNRGAYDVTGLEGQRLAAFDISDKLVKSAGANPDELGIFFQGGGGVTDRVTSLAVQSAENALKRGVDERSNVLFGQRERISTPQLSQAFEEMQKVTVRGFRGVAQSGLTISQKGFGDVIQASLRRDPASMYGIEEIGTTVSEQGFAGTFKMRQDALNKRLRRNQKMLGDGGVWTTRKDKKTGTWTDELKPFTQEEFDALRVETNQLIFANSHVPVVMLEPGEWAPLSHGKLVDNYTPRKILTEGGLGEQGKAIWQIKRDEEFKTRLGIGSDGELYLPDGKSRLEQLDPEEMIHMFHVGRAMSDHFGKTGMTFAVPKNPSWFHLDIAEQIMQKGEVSGASVAWPEGMTRETAKVESFAQKVDLLRTRKAQIKALSKGGLNMPLDPADVFKMKVMLNLPRIDSYTAGLMQTAESPIDFLMAGLKSGDDVRKMSHAELVKALNDSRQIVGMTDETPGQLKDLFGTSFDFLQHEGNPIAPIMGMRRPLAPFQWTRDDLFIRQSTKAAHVRESLLGERADPFTRELTNALTSDPSFGLARNVTEIADDQARSFVPGFRNSAPQTTLGALANAVTFKNRRDVDAPVMLAASHQQELKNRVANAVVKGIFDGNMGDAVTRITSAGAARSRMLLNQMLTFREGWILKAKPAEITLPDGSKGYKFVLEEESELNKQGFRDAFGRELEKGQALLSPKGTEIVLDELSMDVFARMQLVHQQTLAAKNTALRSQGLPQINQQQWYAPPANIRGKYLAFTFDHQNQVVRNMTIVADTPDQLTRAKEALMKSDQWQDTYTIRSKDDAGSFMTLWDKAQMDFIMPNVTAIQPGKPNLGRLAGAEINENAFADALVTMRDSLMSHADDVLEIIHDDAIKSAKTRSQIAKVESEVGNKEAVHHSSQYDRYVQNLTGASSLGAKDSFFGDMQRILIDRIDGFLKSIPANKPASVKARASQAFSAYSDWIRAAIPGKSPKGDQFNQFAKELGNYMPYKSAQEMAERQTQAARAPEAAELASKLSWFEAGSKLRWFESMHAVVNIGSILANTPAVIRALQPRTGESLAEAAARNSSLSMALAVNGEEGVVIPNAFKLMWQGMRDAWKPTGIAVIDEAQKRAFRLGMMDQEVAEYNAAWGAIESKAGWKKFMFGDSNHGGNGLADRFIRSGGVDRAISILSDKSEQLTRQWGMQMGYRVGHAIGIDDADMLNNFAKEITDKLITNYDPRNRPELFQGPLGAMAGLFQSYAFNFYGRMFRYAETGDFRSLATQYAMQTAVFGTASNPGWQALNWAFFDRGDGKLPEGMDPVESIYHRFGPAAGDLLMHGTISSLPKIFGLDGVSVYTRGDSEVRLPVINMPVFDTASRIFSGLGAVASSLKESGSIGPNHLAEIMSNVVTNRPLAGMIETMGTQRSAGTLGEGDPGNFGYDTAWDGQVVAESRNMAEAVYRMLGIRSMAQQKEIEAFYQNRTSQEEQNARKDVVRAETRAAIRDGRFDEVPALFQKYVEAGGDSRYYSRWLKETFESALDSRSERQLEKVLKDPENRNMQMIGRLLDAQIDVNEGEQAADDYGRDAQIDQMVEQGWEGTPSIDAAATEEAAANGIAY